MVENITFSGPDSGRNFCCKRRATLAPISRPCIAATSSCVPSPRTGFESAPQPTDIRAIALG
ncbi:MAG: hypothetical protein VX860_01155 [Verrucomicrobiota bacterium]|nr:hypothetical protein [Verrucomicrobiota bacterium]